MGSVIGFIGAGNMATAILHGMLSGSAQWNISVYDVDASRSALWGKLGCHVCSSSKELAKNSDIIFLAVKPQNIDDVLRDIADSLESGTLIISIAAGVSIKKIRNIIGDYPVVRVMPNACMTVMEGASAVSFSDNVTEAQLDTAVKIFRSCGTVEVIDESLQDAVIGVNGSSPAYVFLFAKAVVDEAEAEGIDRTAALELICGTLRGSAKMMLENNSIDELISIITSRGGTTEAALRVLNENGFYDSLRKATQACLKRARELGGN